MIGGIGSATVAGAKVLLGVDDASLTHGLDQAKANTGEAVGSMRTSLSKLEEAQLKVKLKQDAFASATAKYGSESKQAKTALLGLSGAERDLYEQTHRADTAIRHATTGLQQYGRHAKDAHANVERAARGGIAASGVFSSLGRSVAFASSSFLGGAGFTYLIKQSVGEASDLVEQMNKVDRVFRGSAPEVKKWAQNAATSMGMADSEALAFAGTFGNLLHPMGIARDQAAAMSMTMVQLAADMASFNNRDPEEALMALQSGLAGQVRPLRQFGVFLSKARIEAEALADGIVKPTVKTRELQQAQESYAIAEAKLAATRKKYGANTTQVASAELTLEKAADRVHKAMAGHTGQLTAAQKGLATYRIILKDTADTQGDYKNTSDKVANRQRTLTGLIKNTEEVIGKALYPTWNKMLGGLIAYIDHGLKSGEIQKKLNTVIERGSSIVHGLWGAFQRGLPILKGVVGALGGAKHAVEILLIAFAVNKVRLFATAAVTSINTIGKAALFNAAIKAGADEAMAASSVASAGVMTTAIAGVKAAMISALITTGIGVVVVAIGIAVLMIIKHWDKVKQWLLSFGDWLKQHMVLIASTILGPFGFIAAEIIRHWSAVKTYLGKFAADLKLIFTHPLAGVKALFRDTKDAVVGIFTGLWTWLKRTAFEVADKILQAFSHLPGKMGDWARKARAQIKKELDGMTADAQTAGAQAGDQWGQAYYNNIAKWAAAAKGIADQGVGDATSDSPNRAGGGNGRAGGAGTTGSVVQGGGGFQGHPGAGTHSRTERGYIWQDDDAVDIEMKPGAAVYAIENGVIGYDLRYGGDSGRFSGWGFQLNASSGNDYYYKHLRSVVIRQGQRVKQGQVLGHGTTTGHLHLAKKGAQTDEQVLGAPNTSTGNTGGNTGGDTSGTGGTNPPLHVGTTPKKPKKTKIELIPKDLQLELAAAEASKGKADDLRVLLKIETYLVERIKHEKNVDLKIKLLRDLKTTRAKIEAIEKTKDTAESELIPKSLRNQLKLAKATSGDYNDDIAALEKIVAFLTAAAAKEKNINEKIRLLKLLDKERIDLRIARARQAKIDEDIAWQEELDRIDQLAENEQKLLDAMGEHGWTVVEERGPDPQKLKIAEDELALAKRKLAEATAKYGAGSKEVAAATIVVEKANKRVTDAKNDKSKVTGKHLEGETQVVFDPKTGKWIVTKVKPDLDAMREELRFILEEKLPVLKTLIEQTDAAIKRLSKHKKKNQRQLAHLKKVLEAYKKEQEELIALAKDLAISINDLVDALKDNPEEDGGEPEPEPNPDTGSSDTGGGFSGSDIGSAADDAASKAEAEAERLRLEQLMESNLTGYLGGLNDLNRGFASNVLAAAFAGQLGPLPLAGGQGTNITVTNWFNQAPEDPHTFTKSLEFELKAILA